MSTIFLNRNKKHQRAVKTETCTLHGTTTLDHHQHVQIKTALLKILYPLRKSTAAFHCRKRIFVHPASNFTPLAGAGLD